jgi:electron transport complex protein RnfC
MPCIRCGACAEACPHELQPFEMYWFARAKNFGKTQEYNIFDCIECGCCSYVCPSHIPLVQYFRFAKSEIWARERDKKASDLAKARFEFRNLRDEREKAEKAERLAKAAAAKAAEKKTVPVESGGRPAATPDTPVDADAAKKATIAAAIERARVQRETAEPKNTDGLTIAQRKEIAEIEARRAPLLASEQTAPNAETQRTQSTDT